MRGCITLTDSGGRPPGIKISPLVDLPGGGPSDQHIRRSWLLDTGAAASMIFSQRTGNLGIHYLTPPDRNGGDPTLLDENNNPVPEQFDM